MRKIAGLLCMMLIMFGVSAQEKKINIDSLSQQELFKMVMDALSKHNEEVEQEVSERLAPGSMSPDFEYISIDGDTCSLKDFRGKYVFIDVWATWCGPCCKEIPYLEELEEKMKNKNIVFVSISCDANRMTWARIVKEKKLGGIQLHMRNDSSFKEAYGIGGIPRFILLDKEGRVINTNMTRPSNPKTAEVLEALEGM